MLLSHRCINQSLPKKVSGRWGDRPLGRWGWREPCSESSSASSAHAKRANRSAALASSGPAQREAEPTSEHVFIFSSLAEAAYRTPGLNLSVLCVPLGVTRSLVPSYFRISASRSRYSSSFRLSPLVAAARLISVLLSSQIHLRSRSPRSPASTSKS